MKIQWARVAHGAAVSLIGLAPSVPDLVDHLGWSTTAGIGGALVVIAGGVTRVTHIPAVKTWLKAKLHVSYN